MHATFILERDHSIMFKTMTVFQNKGLKFCSPIDLKMKVELSYSNIRGVYCIFSLGVFMLPITVCYTLGVTLVLSLTSNLIFFSKWPVVTSLCVFFTLIYDR